MDPLYDLTDRVAIVTGGGTGIGAATAMLLAKHGADTVIAARTMEDLERTSTSIESATGRRCLMVQTDVKQEDQVARLAARTMEELGKVDILVNNAGGTRLGALKDLPTKGWDAIFDLNTKSTFLCTREVGQHMIAAGTGNIINISSGAGMHGIKGGAHYSAAKSAVQMFTKVTAAEWGRYGIRVNCIGVGAIASERVLAAWEVAQLKPEELASCSLGRVGTPDEIANAILFLVSDAASYVTGQTLGVDGGPSMGGGPPGV